MLFDTHPVISIQLFLTLWGGKSKGVAQFKDVQADRKYIFTHSDQTDGIRRPLFMLGYLK